MIDLTEKYNLKYVIPSENIYCKIVVSILFLFAFLSACSANLFLFQDKLQNIIPIIILLSEVVVLVLNNKNFIKGYRTLLIPYVLYLFFNLLVVTLALSFNIKMFVAEIIKFTAIAYQLCLIYEYLKNGKRLEEFKSMLHKGVFVFIIIFMEGLAKIFVNPYLLVQSLNLLITELFIVIIFYIIIRPQMRINEFRVKCLIQTIIVCSTLLISSYLLLSYLMNSTISFAHFDRWLVLFLIGLIEYLLYTYLTRRTLCYAGLLKDKPFFEPTKPNDKIKEL